MRHISWKQRIVLVMLVCILAGLVIACGSTTGGVGSQTPQATRAATPTEASLGPTSTPTEPPMCVTNNLSPAVVLTSNANRQRYKQTDLCGIVVQLPDSRTLSSPNAAEFTIKSAKGVKPQVAVASLPLESGKLLIEADYEGGGVLASLLNKVGYLDPHHVQISINGKASSTFVYFFTFVA